MYNRFTKCWLILLFVIPCYSYSEEESKGAAIGRVSAEYNIPSGIFYEILDGGYYKNDNVDEIGFLIKLSYEKADFYFQLHPINISSGDLIILKWIIALNIFNDSPRKQYPDSYKMPLIQRYAITYPQGLKIMYDYHEHYFRYMLTDGMEWITWARNPIMGTICSPECAQLFTNDFICYMQLR